MRLKRAASGITGARFHIRCPSPASAREADRSDFAARWTVEDLCRARVHLVVHVAGHKNHGKAIFAVAHTLIVIIWHLLNEGTTYDDLGSDYFDRRNDTEHRQRYLGDNSRSSATTSPSNQQPDRNQALIGPNGPSWAAAPHPATPAQNPARPEEFRVRGCRMNRLRLRNDRAVCMALHLTCAKRGLGKAQSA